MFNQSSHTFAFGAREIVSILTDSLSAQKVDVWTFEESEQDYTKGMYTHVVCTLKLLPIPDTSKDSTVLDIWAWRKVQELFRNAKHNRTLSSQLCADGLVIYIHLLGLDVTGHSYRPHSQVRDHHQCKCHSDVR